MRRAAASLVLGLVAASCAKPTPTSEVPRTSLSATAPPAAVAAAPALAVPSGAKSPWREPVMLTTPRHPLADARVVAIGAEKAVVRTVNAAVWVRGAGGVERSQLLAKDEALPPSAADVVPVKAAQEGCTDQLRWLTSWAKLIEPTSLATLRSPAKPPPSGPCVPPAETGRVRNAAPGDATEPCEYAECLRGTTDQEPELTRTHLALVAGRCAVTEADDAGACRAGAQRTHDPEAVLADLEARTVTFLPAPPACHPTRALAAGGLPLLLCDGGPTALWVAQPDGTWRSEGSLPVRDEDIGGVALASDGTLLLRASWKDPARRRAFVRAPRAAGEAGAWREVRVGDALDVRVAPNGSALVLRAAEGGRALSIDLDTEAGRRVLAPRVALDAHVLDVSIERGKVALWTLPRMQRGRPPAGSPAARGGAEAFAVLADGSLSKLPPAP